MFATANQMVLAVKDEMERASAMAASRAAKLEEKEASLQRDKRELQQRCTDYERRICDLADQLQECEASKVELINKLQEGRNSVKEAQNLKLEVSQLQERLSESESTVGRLSANAEHLNSELMTRRQLYLEELEEMEQRYKQSSKQVASLKAERDEVLHMAEENQAHQAERNILLKEIEQANCLLEESASKIHELQAALHSSNERASRHEQERNAATQKHADAEDQLHSWKEENQNQLSQLHKENMLLKEEKAEMQATIQSLTAREADGQAACQAEIEKVQKQCQQLQQDKHALKLQLEQDEAALAAEMRRAQATKEDHEKQLSIARNEINVLKAEVEQGEASATTQLQHKDDLQRTARKALEESQQRCQLLERDCEHLRGELLEMQEMEQLARQACETELKRKHHFETVCEERQMIINMLQAQLEAAKEERAEQIQSLEQLECSVSDIERTMSLGAGEKTRLSKQLHAERGAREQLQALMESSIANMSSEKQAAEKELEKLRNDLLNASERTESLCSDARLLEAELRSALNMQGTGLARADSRRSSGFQDMESQHLHNIEEAIASQSRCFNLIQRVSAKVKEHDQLSKHVGELEAKLQGNDSKETLEQLSSLSRECRALRQANQRDQDAIAAYEERTKTLERQLHDHHKKAKKVVHSLEKKLAEEELKVSAAKLQLEQVEPKWEDRCSKLHQQMKAMEKEMAMTQLKLSEAEGRCIALSQESKEWVGQINIMDANHASDLEKAMAEIATYKQEILRRDKMIAQLQKQIKELERTIRNISTETGEEISEATEELRRRESEMERLREQARRAQEGEVALTAEHTIMSARFADMSTNYKTMEQQCAASTQLISHLETEKKQLLRDVTIATKTKGDLEKQLKELRAELEESRQYSSRFDEEKQKRQEAETKADSNESRFKKIKGKHEKDVEEFKRKLARLEAQLEQEKAKVMTLEGLKLSDSVAECERLTKLVKTLESELYEAKHNVEKQAKRHAQGRIEELEREYEKMKQEMEEKISALERQLDDAQAAVENANLSAQSAHENARDLWTQLTASQKQTEELTQKLENSEVIVCTFRRDCCLLTQVAQADVPCFAFGVGEQKAVRASKSTVEKADATIRKIITLQKTRSGDFSGCTLSPSHNMRAGG